MDISLSSELAGVPDLNHQVRSLSGFRKSFSGGVALLCDHLSVSAVIDDTKLTSAFLAWAEKFDAEKRNARADRKDFAVYACGLMLGKLLRFAPLRVVPRPGHSTVRVGPEAQEIVGFWAEGFILTSYCASVLDAVLTQEYGRGLSLQAKAYDLRTWWSYRENVGEDPSLAIGFFDLFLGIDPNWTQPEAAFARPAIRAVFERGLEGSPIRDATNLPPR